MLPIRALLNLFRNVMKYSNNEQQIELDSTALKTVQTGHTYTNPRQCGYLTHVHSHITQAVAATDSCVTLIGARQLGIAFGLLNGENPRLTAEVSAKQSIKRQLHTTHVVVFPHPVACCWMLWRVDAQSLKPVNFSANNSQHFFRSVIAEA